MVLGLDREARAQSQFEPFTFAYVTDSHLVTGQPDSYKLLQESQLFLQDVVKNLNSQKIDFVLFGGDQVEGPGKDDVTWQLFLDIAQTLNAPWNFVLGESDVSGSIMVDKLRTFGPDWKGKGITSNKTYWSQDPVPGIHVIGLDTARPNLQHGEMSNVQMEWLKDDLARHQGRFTIVVSHHPLLPPPPYDSGPPWDDDIVVQGATAREILGNCRNVRLALNGHVHVTRVQQERHIWYLSRPSLSVYPCAYSIFRVTPEAIAVETYQVTFPALIKKARKLLSGSTMAFRYNSSRPDAFAELTEGGQFDTNVSLPLLPGRPITQLAKRKKAKPKQAEPKPKKKETPRKDEPPKKEEAPLKQQTPVKEPAPAQQSPSIESQSIESPSIKDQKVTPPPGQEVPAKEKPVAPREAPPIKEQAPTPGEAPPLKSE